VHTFVKTNQHFSKTDISHHCKEQDFEISAIQLVTKTPHIIILSLYRAPSGEVKISKESGCNFRISVQTKAWVYNLWRHRTNYLNESSQKKKQVNCLLRTYNLSHTVNFATRVQNSLSTAIDSSCTSPIVNSFSDHDSQFLKVNNIILEVNSRPLKQKTRKINTEHISHFQCLLENKHTNYKLSFFYIF
jgi:hypothetical protein